MQSISGIVYLIIIACLLPYVFAVVAKMAGGFKREDNQNPREFLAKTTGLAARANAVQQKVLKACLYLLLQCSWRNIWSSHKWW